MTTQTAGDMDVFASPAPKAGVVQPEARSRSTEDSVPNGNRTSFVERVKPWHFFVVLAVIAVIWIFVPKFFRSNASTSQGQQFSTQATQPVYVPNERPIPAQAVEEPLSPPQPVADQVEMIQVKNQLETFAKITSELQGQVRELQAKIAVLESRPVDTPPKAKDKVQAVRNQVAAPTSAASKVLTGYSINTVYTDQAWLAHDQRTFVVQVGDVFDGLRVLRIDPVSRQVVTNLGVIR